MSKAKLKVRFYCVCDNGSKSSVTLRANSVKAAFDKLPYSLANGLKYSGTYLVRPNK